MNTPTYLHITEFDPPPILTIRLLGDFVVTYGDEAITQVNTPRLQALLAYLLLHRQAPQSRRRLAFLFWPDSSEEQALTNLRKHLLYLKRALPDGDQWLVADRHTLQWAPQVACKLDVADFGLTLAQAEQSESDVAIALLHQAIDLYQGELLPGCYDDWLLPLREALQGQYFAALERLSTLFEEQRTYAEAIQYSQQLLRYDALHEANYRRLIRLYALNDDRAAALRTYHSCVTQLRNELGVDPDEETQAIYERLLHGAPPTTTTIAQPELAANAPFVGRRPEWQRLQKCWQTALRGTPQFVLIAGEAGIGKTRLAEELLNWANHQGFYTVRARCYAAEGRLAYAPVIDWLRTEKLRQPRSQLAPIWLTELARLLPEVLNDYPALSPPEPLTQSVQRHHLFEAVSRALLAREQPLLLLVDDLQWCDRETLELLHFLLRNAPRLSQTKVLLLGTARLPDEVDAGHPLYELLNSLQASDSLTQMDLARLSAGETAQLATQMAAQPLDARVLNQLFADTAGNPLFVVETMRARHDPKRAQGIHNGLTNKANSSHPIPEEDAAIVQHLPPKVLAVIQGRLRQLSSAARELCEWASIVGRSFTLDLLVCASTMAQDKAVNALDELWQRRIIREQGSDGYDFSHDRIRDVVTAGISRVRRKYLHRRVAEALEHQQAAQLDTMAAILAAHFDAAGSIEQAIAYYQRAAIHAPQIYANYDAVPYLQRAIVLLSVMSESVERDQRELALLTAFGPALATVGPDATVLISDLYAQADTLSQRLNVALHPSFSRIFAIHRVGRQDYTQALSVGQQLLRMAGKQASSAEKLAYVEGCYVLGITDFLQGRFGQAKHHLQQAGDSHALLQKPYNSIEYAQDIGITSKVRLGWNLWYLGYPDQARHQCDIALQAANQLRHPLTKLVVLGYATACACTLRDAVTADITYQQRFDNYLGTDRTRPLDSFYIGWIKVLCGDKFEGTQQLLKHISSTREMDPNGTYVPHRVAIVCEALQQTGNFEQGLGLLKVAFSLLNGNQNYWHIADMYRIKGELLLGVGDCSEAESCFQRALDTSRHQQAKSLELRAAMSIACLWNKQGKRNKARELLAGVYNWFTEGFDTPDLQDAKNLLKQLS
ncbi:MAG: AAA family ATPase [Caldilineaceae bacterium]